MLAMRFENDYLKNNDIAGYKEWRWYRWWRNAYFLLDNAR
jgi:hypothetical protein